MVVIRLRTIENVKDFINITSKFDEEITVSCGRYVVDGKSILGIMSLNLLSELIVEIDTDDTKIRNELVDKLSAWQVN